MICAKCHRYITPGGKHLCADRAALEVEEFIADFGEWVLRSDGKAALERARQRYYFTVDRASKLFGFLPFA